MDWDDVRVFEVLADAPSLSAAAAKLGVSIATVSRRMDALEAALGLKLIERSPRGLHLTGAGAAMIERVRGAAEAMHAVGRQAELLANSHRRPVRISAPEPIAAELLAPALPRLLQAAPEVRIELESSTRVVSLSARDADIAVRLALPVGDSLTVRALPSIQLGLFCSADYLRGRPADAIIVADERLLSYDDSYGPLAETAWLNAAGLQSAITIRSSSTRVLLNAALAGVGVALLPTVLATRHQELRPIAAPLPIPERPLWLLFHRDYKLSRNHRLVRRWVTSALSSRSGFVEAPG